MALSANFLPAHWNIPNWEDWDILNAYLKEDVSLLKSGTWLPLKTGETAQPANNLSGFNAAPVGMWVEPNQNIFEGKHLAYWTLDDTNAAIADDVFYLKSDANTIERSAPGVEKKAFAIRCIRK